MDTLLKINRRILHINSVLSYSSKHSVLMHFTTICLTKNRIHICVYAPNIQMSWQTVKVMLMEMQKWRNQCRIDRVCSSRDCIVLLRSSTSRDTSATLHQRRTKWYIRQGNINIESDYWTHTQTRVTDSAKIIHKEKILQRLFTFFLFLMWTTILTHDHMSKTLSESMSCGLNLNGLKLCEHVVISLCGYFFI